MTKFLSLIAIVFILVAADSFSQISEDSLKKHVYFMAADSNEGRYGGTKVMERVSEYIAENFRNTGIKPFGKEFFQIFPKSPYYGKNIIGVIEGSDSVLKNEYIILGAHYDHIGWYMKDDSTKIVYNGADDNASGTGGIIEIGRKLAKNRNLLKRSILIIAFDAEEQGLIGSKYFIKHPPLDLKKVKTMLSIDMIGALNKGKKLTFSGCSSFNGGTEFMNNIKKIDSLPVEFIPSSFLWKDRTDTSPFYDSTICCMYVSTGLESPYHKPEDDADSIDFKGMVLACEQIYNATVELSAKKDFEFSKTHEAVRVIQGPVRLGVSLNFNTNFHNFSDGPFLAKSLYGFGGGLFSVIKVYKSFGIKPEVNYSYYGTKSSGGNIRLSTIDIPLSLVLSTNEDMGGAYLQFGGYFNYALSGTLDGKKIDWEKQNFSKTDYGLQYGFGFYIFNFHISYMGKSGYSNFFKRDVPGFGKGMNSTFIFSVGYFFLP